MTIVDINNIKAWMRYSPNHIFIADGVSWIRLSDNFWRELKS